MNIKQPIVQKKIWKFSQGTAKSGTDAIVIEEPLEIRISHGTFPERRQQAVSVTMRTPGDDRELAAGFLFTEGIIQSRADITDIRHIPTSGKFAKGNVLLVTLAEGTELDMQRLDRHFYTTSSCGVCGKTSIEAVQTTRIFPPGDEFTISQQTLLSLPSLLREQQALFGMTGGLHAAALFDKNGKLSILKEDIGRHNAVDKVIGAQFLQDSLPLKDSLMLVSGRGGFELIQKAVMAGVPMFAAVGAPSSLAVELAKGAGMTLIGFLKEDGFNVYCGRGRVQG